MSRDLDFIPHRVVPDPCVFFMLRDRLPYRSLRPSGAILAAHLRWTKETLDVRFPFRRSWPRADRAHGALRPRAGAGLIMLEAIVGLTVALAVGAYLILTLIAPEKF
ncbi:potassium-transporting ATPase subunit F [Rhodobacter viridis]|uniref:potassium-transporting ATPase subunit F n=1 Tax=Rhodobacter viridis TaxID=1054202 RepID=UPI0011B737E4|nr:potassium-transporting ATPase subunit F [Rhodobacter viridis]